MGCTSFYCLNHSTRKLSHYITTKVIQITVYIFFTVHWSVLFHFNGNFSFILYYKSTKQCLWSGSQKYTVLKKKSSYSIPMQKRPTTVGACFISYSYYLAQLPVNTVYIQIIFLLHWIRDAVESIQESHTNLVFHPLVPIGANREGGGGGGKNF